MPSTISGGASTTSRGASPGSDVAFARKTCHTSASLTAMEVGIVSAKVSVETAAVGIVSAEVSVGVTEVGKGAAEGSMAAAAGKIMLAFGGKVV